MPSRQRVTGRLLRLEGLLAMFIYSSIPKILPSRHRQSAAHIESSCLTSDMDFQHLDASTSDACTRPCFPLHSAIIPLASPVRTATAAALSRSRTFSLGSRRPLVSTTAASIARARSSNDLLL